MEAVATRKGLLSDTFVYKNNVKYRYMSFDSESARDTEMKRHKGEKMKTGSYISMSGQIFYIEFL